MNAAIRPSLDQFHADRVRLAVERYQDLLAPILVPGPPGQQGQVGLTGPDGLAGADGAPGADGADGADGATWHSGSGVPGGGTGVDGDFYFNTATGDVYGPKAAGAWGAIASSLLGPPGADGADGADGAPGVGDALTTGHLGQFAATNSAQLRGVMSDETGTGFLYFQDGALGTPASGNLGSCTADGTDAVGFRNIPQNSQSAAYTLVLADSGKHIYHPSADTTARIFTIPANASVAFPIGTAITFVNDSSAGVITISITSDTLVLLPGGTTGSRTLAANNIATAIKVTSTRWVISGTSGLT